MTQEKEGRKYDRNYRCRRSQPGSICRWCIRPAAALDYCIGVSAGAANCVSYIAGQRGRNLEFYTKYNFSSKSIGILAWLKTRGSFIDLDYIYGKLSRSTGKSPLDFEAVMASPTQFKVVATDSETGEAVYFDKTDLRQDDYRVICASSCTPEVCKPYPYKGRTYYDGYVSDDSYYLIKDGKLYSAFRLKSEETDSMEMHG